MHQLTDLVPAEEGLKILAACIDYHLSQRKTNERFSAVIQRLGLDHLRRATESDE